MRRYTILFLLNILLIGHLFSTTVTIAPSGTSNDSDVIQAALDSIQNGDTLLLLGDFTIRKTIYLPSDFTWILKGTLTLGSDPSLDKVGWEGTIDGFAVSALKYTGIAEKNWNTTGSSNINMSGGIYDGNYVSQGSSRVRFINFVRVTNSNFQDMEIKKASDDNLTLGPDSRHNVCRNLYSSHAGLAVGSSSGNALTDKGDNNNWYDCTAANCTSDGWTPKCRYSTFIRCIAENNEGPGFGMYAREEGYADNKDVGAHIIGNKFIDCVSYGSLRSSGFSFNISSNCPGAIIQDNYIQAVCYDNQGSGVYFRNKDDAQLGIINNNEVDIVCYGNKGLNKSGSTSSWAGGLGMENDNSSSHNLIENITGSVVCYNNRVDVNTKGGHNCSITVYHPAGEKDPVLVKGGSNNAVNVIDFFCSDSLDAWCQQKYCGSIPPTLPSDPENLVSTTVSSSQINLSWTDNSSDETGFKIERKTIDSFSEIATVGADVNTYQNIDLSPSTTYTYRVRAFNSMGYSDYSNEDSATTAVAVGIHSLFPSEANVVKHKSYPNPFNHETTISYELSENAEISINIYSIDGQKVRTLLANKKQRPGFHSIKWNTHNENGNNISNGIYFCVIRGVNKNGSFINCKKMNYMK